MPSLTTTTTANKQNKPAATDPTSVSTIGRRKLGKETLSEYQKEQQAKKDKNIVDNMFRRLSHQCLDVDEEGPRRRRMEQLRKSLRRNTYVHLPSDAFKTYWHEATERLEEDVQIRLHQMEEKKKKANKRKRNSDVDMTIPRKRLSIPGCSKSIGSSEDAVVNIPKIPRKRPSVEQTNEVVDLVDTDDDDEQEWGGDDDADERADEIEKDTEQQDKPQEKQIEVAPEPAVEIDPFEKAGPNRWANLMLGSKFQGERFAFGEWDSIEPVTLIE